MDAPDKTDEPVDVAAVLKAKSKTKEKSAAEIAAATAAKEAKAKADKKAADEKKKVCDVVLYFVFTCKHLISSSRAFVWGDRKRRRTKRSMRVQEGKRYGIIIKTLLGV